MAKDPNKSNNAPRQGRFVAIRRAADAWYLAVASPSAGGPRITETLSVPLADEAGLDKALTRIRPDVLVGVVPTGQTVWRAVDAPPPSGTPAEVAAALDLIAEAHAPTGTPPHRRACGLLRLTAHDSGLAAVAWTGELQGWPDALAQAVARWVPEPAAVAWLAAATGRAPGVLHVACDRPTGAIALVGLVPGDRDQVPELRPRVVARVLREDGADPAEWAEAVGAAAEEIAQAAGLSSEHAVTTPDRASTVLLGAATEAPAGQGFMSDRDWLDRFGIVSGAAAMAAWHDPASAPLLAMRPNPPTQRRSIIEFTVEWLARPARAYAVIAACLVVAALWPLGVAYSRWSILKAQAAEAAPTKADYLKAAEEADFYQALRERRLPLVKTLAELIGPAPKGIIIDSLVVDQRRIVVRGIADSAEEVSAWRNALSSARVFDEVKTPNIESGVSPITWELNATIGQPLLAFTPSGTPVTVAPTPRSQQQPAAAPVGEPGSRRSSESGAGQGKAPPSRSTRTGTGTTRESARPSAPAGSEPAAKGAPVIPPPISADEIAALDRGSAIREFAARRAASVNPQVDEPTRNRLADEAARLQERMRTAPQGGGS